MTDVFLHSIIKSFAHRKYRRIPDASVRSNLLRALWLYIAEVKNILDVLAILATLLIIPCRIADDDCQWVFAAIAYILQGLRIFKHAVMFK